LAGYQRPGNLLALAQRQHPIRSVAHSWPDATGLGQDPADGGVMPVKKLGNLVK